MDHSNIVGNSSGSENDKELEVDPKAVEIISRMMDKLGEVYTEMIHSMLPYQLYKALIDPCYPTLQAIAKRQRERGARGTRRNRRKNRLKYERRMLKLKRGPHGFAWAYWERLNDQDLCPFPTPKG